MIAKNNRIQILQNTKNQYPPMLHNYSDNGKPNQTRSLEKLKKTNYPKAYAPNQGDDGEKPMTLKPG